MNQNAKNLRWWRQKRKPGKKESWGSYFVGLIKKGWESAIGKAITTGLFALAMGLFYNLYQNPYIDFTIQIEVFDAQTGRGLNNAEIYVQDTNYHFTTDDQGKAEVIIKVRRNTDHVVLTCTADHYKTQQKKIDVLLEKKPVFPTRFILDYSYLQ